MGRLAGFKYRDVARRLKRLGFQFDRQAAGSHEIWLNNHLGDLPEGTLRAILKQAEIQPDEFLQS